MASVGRDKPVLLGFVDEYAASDRENFYTNKVHPYCNILSSRHCYIQMHTI